MKRLQTYAPAASAFALALLVRIIYNLTVGRNYVPTFDAALYNTLGRQLVDHGCYCLYASYPTLSRPPLWPFILAVIYAFAGKEEFHGRLFYCFLGSGTCTLIYLFSRDLFGRKIALFSGLLAAIYPCLFIYDGWLYTESLYTFCLTACVYALYRLQLQYAPFSKKSLSEKRWPRSIRQALLHHRWSILCGLLIGLAALARPNGIFLSGLVVIWAALVILAKIQTWKPVLIDTVLITCIAILIILPWSYRNYQVSHSFVLVSTGMGEVLAGAYNNAVLEGGPSIRGTWRPVSNSLNHDAYNYSPRDDAADTARALSWIRNHFSTLPYLLSLHFINMWIPYTYSHGLAFEEPGGSSMYTIMIIMIYVLATIVILFAFIGLFLTWKQYKRQLLVIYLLLALVILQNVLFYSDMRFRAPIEPVLVILAGRALYEFALFAKPKNRSKVAI
ncbi:MAG TPA: glycosyltransferase family 39 protein [Ktedonobacteraceae bacterium]|nr:glycosyltransferase family 39 protein [Ktedonobacteraceae bacterium]